MQFNILERKPKLNIKINEGEKWDTKIGPFTIPNKSGQTYGLKKGWQIFFSLIS